MDETDNRFGRRDEGAEESAEFAPENAPEVSPKPRKSGGAGRWLAFIVVIAAGFLAYRHFVQPASSPTTESRGVGQKGHNAPQPVGVATVQSRDLHVVIDALGTVTPLSTVTVVSQISGYLQKVGFKEGQEVKKGDFLAQIDPRPYQALKAQYEGQLAHDKGLLAQARADLKRYQTLLKQNSIAKQTADNQVYVVQQYEGTVRADQALIDQQALNIAYCHIVAPIDGRMGLRLVDPGNYIQAGSTGGIAVITELKPISVIFSVPEGALQKILPQMRDGNKLIATAYGRGNVHKIASGIVTVLDNQVDVTTGMVKLRAQFANKDEKLFPNQFVNIRLLVDVLKGATAAPLAAVQHGAPGDYAYVVTRQDKASVRVLKLGETDGGYVQILSGLKPGDRVVVDGADRLREGAAVSAMAENEAGAIGGGKPAKTRAAGANGAPP